ncbi:MAG: DNA polymerase Y family protein [Pseudomonadota bacterium]|nr:DNA polymerase Y family protein [Pseudomonadota bacterium]
MHWLALHWSPPDAAGEPLPSREALAWWALAFTPRVAWVDEALLMEVSACERLWGGRRALLARVLQSNPAPDQAQQARAATSMVALARLRWYMAQGVDAAVHPRWPAPADLPLHTLGAARAHLPLLARLGCRTWGDVDALPRAGLARRFGPALGRALDVALGRAPDVYAWATLPDRFEQALDLPERADSAPALLWSARRLLHALQLWLAARQQGVLALALAWTFDQRRLNGHALPPEGGLTLRTAEPVQAMAHIQRLLAERLARTALQAPARAIRLRVLQTAPWQPDSASFLPEDQPRGEPLHVFIERVGARLGAGSLRVPVLRPDHRPECRQGWRAAVPGRTSSLPASAQTHLPDALAPTWLLREPLPLAVQADGQPCHHGPLRLLAGPRRIETGWWPDDAVPATCAAARDYYIAQNPAAELLWVYRERATSAQHGDGADAAPRWFLQGLYA